MPLNVELLFSILPAPLKWLVPCLVTLCYWSPRDFQWRGGNVHHWINHRVRFWWHFEMKYSNDRQVLDIEWHFHVSAAATFICRISHNHEDSRRAAKCHTDILIHWYHHIMYHSGVVDSLRVKQTIALQALTPCENSRGRLLYRGLQWLSDSTICCSRFFNST